MSKPNYSTSIAKDRECTVVLWLLCHLLCVDALICMQYPLIITHPLVGSLNSTKVQRFLTESVEERVVFWLKSLLWQELKGFPLMSRSLIFSHLFFFFFFWNIILYSTSISYMGPQFKKKTLGFNKERAKATRSYILIIKKVNCGAENFCPNFTPSHLPNLRHPISIQWCSSQEQAQSLFILPRH